MRSGHKAALIGTIIAGISILAIMSRFSTSYYPVDRFAGLTAQITGEGLVMISGHVMGSYYCVGKIDSAVNDGELNIRMRPRYFCPQQRSGDFEVLIKVPHSSVTRVTYGDQRTPIARPTTR